MIKDIDAFSEALSQVKIGYFIAQCTDALIIEKIDENYFWDTDYMFKRAFDIRIFNKNSEVHLFRSSIEKTFNKRTIISDEDAICFTEDNYKTIVEDENVSVYYDEEQYLNIDTTRTDHEKQKVHAIGGGEYKLPIGKYNDAKILIRNYIGFEEKTGRAYVKDWRIVDFVEGR